MKKNYNHNFKVGDTVYTYHNASWGMKPMKVMELTEDGIRCKNPDFSGIGWFAANECKLATSGRKLALVELKARMDELDQLKKKLFLD
jgi:hypothetical protein